MKPVAIFLSFFCMCFGLEKALVSRCDENEFFTYLFLTFFMAVCFIALNAEKRKVN